MNDKLYDLISYLMEHDQITAKQLANIFNVSDRSIRNYIQVINKSYNNLILSSNKGYSINYAYSMSDIILNKNQIKNFNQEQRKNYVLKELLFSNRIDYFDLSERLYVSEHTILSDINKIRVLLNEYDLTIKRKSTYFSLIGEEQNKRKILCYLIFKESNGFLPDYISHYKDTNILNKLTINTRRILNNDGLFYNDYTLENIVIHLLIYIQRISEDYFLSDNNTSLPLNFTKESQSAAKELAAMLTEEFDVVIPNIEITYLILLIDTNTTSINAEDLIISNYQEYIGDYYVEITKKIIDSINKYFSLDIDNDDFLIRLALHIKALCSRSVKSHFIANPFTNQMKATYPFIYEIGVFISSILKKEEQIFINDDEIAFLAFHIGSYIELKNEKQSIKCLLIIPDYHIMRQLIYNNIKTRLKRKVHIQETTTYDLPQDIFDFYISYKQIPKLNLPLFKIPLFPENQNFLELEKYVDHLISSQSYSKVANKYLSLNERQLFKLDYYHETSTKMIQALAEELINLGYVRSDFTQMVLERESLSSTAYIDNIAFPHAMEMNANKTVLSIVINQKPILWGKRTVNIIILIACSMNERKLFRELTEVLTSRIYNDSSFIFEIMKCKSYGNFIDIIFDSKEDDR